MEEGVANKLANLEWPVSRTLHIRVPNHFTVSHATKDAMDPGHTHGMAGAVGPTGASDPNMIGSVYCATMLETPIKWDEGSVAERSDLIPVTEEMVAAGSKAVLACGVTDDAMVTAYRAMAALAPVAPTWGEIVTLGVERDALAASCAAVTLKNEEMATEITLLRQALAAKDARIAQLKSILATTPVAFEDPDEKPVVKPNPFRDFGHDRRRMGLT